jgi:hypothetical protein
MPHTSHSRIPTGINFANGEPDGDDSGVIRRVRVARQCFRGRRRALRLYARRNYGAVNGEDGYAGMLHEARINAAFIHGVQME